MLSQEKKFRLLRHKIQIHNITILDTRELKLPWKLWNHPVSQNDATLIIIQSFSKRLLWNTHTHTHLHQVRWVAGEKVRKLWKMPLSSSQIAMLRTHHKYQKLIRWLNILKANRRNYRLELIVSGLQLKFQGKNTKNVAQSILSSHPFLLISKN